jgi:hypothetical protein
VGDRFLHIEEFHIDETDNMYLATYRLLAELGIPFHHGIKPPGALSILPGRVQQNFRRDRPLLVLNIWGGQEIDKGYEAFSNKEEILGQDLTVAVNKGYHVILPSFSHATRDGARSKDEWVKKVLSRLPRDIGSHVELGPSPDSQKDDYNDLIRTADLVVTVEGGLMHWVYNLGRRMRVLSMPGSGLLRIFLSVGADSEQLGLPGNDFNQLPSAEELKNQDTETPVPAKTFKGELSWKWLSAIRAERPWLANAIEVAMTAGLYLGIRLFLASLSAGDLASAWAPVLPAAMGFAALHFIGEASSWDAEGNLRTGKLTPLGFAGLTLASLLFILPFAPLSLTVVLTFHGLYSLSASWLGAGLISYGVHFGLYNPHLSRLIAKQWPRLARLFVRGMMGSVPSERFTELLKEIGITRDKDIKRILSGDKYKTPEELEERIRDVSAAIRRVEEEVDMPGFAMPDSSKRAIMKTYLINRARPLDNIVMRPLTDLKVNDLKAHDFVMAHAPQMQAWARYLVNNFKESYRDQETFEDQLRDAVEEFTASIQQKPFAVALHHKGSSNDWVLNLALEMGLPKPVQVVDADNEDNDTLVADRFDNILIIDDAAYTGKQIAIESPASLPANRDRRRKHLHVVIPFMTPEAETRISSEFRHSSGFLIKVYAHQTLGDGAAGPSVRLMGKYFDYFQHILPDDTASESYHQTTGAGRGRPPTVLRAGVVLDDMGLLKGNRVPFLDGYVDRPYRSGYVQDVRNYLISNWDTRICLSAIERSVSRESLVKLIKDMFDIYSNTSDRERMDWLIGQVRALESAGLIDLTATGIRQAAQQLTFIREFQEGHDSKDSMALMPDGRTFVIPSYDGPKPAGKSVNAVSGQFKFIFTNLQHPGPARLSSGGQRAAVAGYEEMVARTGQTVLSAKIFVIDVGTDREIARFDVNSRLRSFTISSNGKSLITVDDGKLHVINIQTRKVRAFPIGQYSGGNPQSLENDRVVIQKVPINGEEELEYGIINYKVGKENVERTIRTPRSSSYEFLGNSQEGKHIVIAGRDKIRIIDADDISHVEEINPPPIPFVSVCYSASARAFVFGLKDGKIQYWRFEDLLSAALPNGTENPVPSPKSELSWKWLSDIRAERPWLANAIEVAITAGLYLGLRLFLVSFGAGDLVSAWIPVLPSAMGFAALHFIGQVTSWDAQGRLQTGKLTPLGFVGLTLASFFFILPFAPLSLTVVLTFHGLYSLAASWLGAGLISYGVHFGLYNPIISRFIAKHWPRLARMFVRGMIDFRWPGSERSRAFPRGVPPHLEQISA